MSSLTYWCHGCDMSLSLHLLPSSTAPETDDPPLCPQCHHPFLELMDCPTSDSSFLLDSPSFRRLLLHFQPPPLAPTKQHHPDFQIPNSTSSSSVSMDSYLPTIKITSSLLQLDCAVCKDPFLMDVDAKQLPCNHLFHPHCILPWLSLHSSCPLCRFSLPPASSLEHHHDDEGIHWETWLRFGMDMHDLDHDQVPSFLHHTSSSSSYRQN